MHDDAVRQLNSLRGSHEMLKTEFNIMNEQVQLTVEQKCADIISQNTALTLETESLRKVIDENIKAFESENKRLQG